MLSKRTPQSKCSLLKNEATQAMHVIITVYPYANEWERKTLLSFKKTFIDTKGLGKPFYWLMQNLVKIATEHGIELNLDSQNAYRYWSLDKGDVKRGRDLEWKRARWTAHVRSGWLELLEMHGTTDEDVTTALSEPETLAAMAEKIEELELKLSRLEGSHLRIVK